MRRLVVLQRLVQSRELRPECLAFVLWGDRRDERSGLERLILEGAVVPDPQQPREPQRGQRDAMVASTLVTGLIPGILDLVKERAHLAGHDAATLQSSQ
jgi:hypothetical protein